VVASADSPHSTVEPLTKLVPVTVSVKATSPAEAEVGLSEAMAGPATVKVDAEDVAPPGLCTVRLSGPAAATMVGGKIAVMDVDVPAVTANAVVPE